MIIPRRMNALVGLTAVVVLGTGFTSACGSSKKGSKKDAQVAPVEQTGSTEPAKTPPVEPPPPPPPATPPAPPAPPPAPAPAPDAPPPFIPVPPAQNPDCVSQPKVPCVPPPPSQNPDYPVPGQNPPAPGQNPDYPVPGQNPSPPSKLPPPPPCDLKNDPYCVGNNPGQNLPPIDWPSQTDDDQYYDIGYAKSCMSAFYQMGYDLSGDWGVQVHKVTQTNVLSNSYTHDSYGYDGTKKLVILDVVNVLGKLQMNLLNPDAFYCIRKNVSVLSKLNVQSCHAGNVVMAKDYNVFSHYNIQQANCY